MALILIIDDSPTEVFQMRRMLENHGFETEGAADGAEGIRKAREIRPDLILMDIVMPDIGGLEVIRRLRRLPLLASTPIIGVSASATPDVEANTLQAGADAFLPKPVDLKALMRCTSGLLKLSWIEGSEQRADASGRAAA